MMKLGTRALGIALASIVGLGGACAADIYTGGGGMKDTYVSPPSWTGFYLGGHVGGAWGELNVKDFDEFPGTFKNEPTDVFGGVQFGYNIQRGHFVFGPEIDLGAMGFNQTATQPGTGGIIKSTQETGFYGDITGRLGYALDHTLIYAKGGFAFFEGDVNITDVGEASVIKGGLTGWTIGGGIEHKFTPNWSLKAEYQYFDFGSQTLILPSDGDRYKSELTAHTFKVGLNYFFQKDYVPLK